MAQAPGVLAKKTKGEILEAYEDLRRRVETEQKEQLPLSVRQAERKEESVVLEKTGSLTPAMLQADIAALKRKLTASLEESEAVLMDESKTLADIRAAIAIERKHLEEVRQIQLADDAIQTLVAEYEQKQQELAAQISKRRSDWQT